MRELVLTLAAGAVLASATSVLAEDAAKAVENAAATAEAAVEEVVSQVETEAVEATIDVPKTLAVGDAMPADFSALDTFGREATFESLKGDNGLIMLFTRSADWCQYCKAQIKEWNGRVDAVKAKGYEMTVISYDSPEKLQAFSEANKINYTLLSDTDSRMIKAFGIRNMNFEEGSRFYGIPDPAIYVFDATGKITYVFREEGFKVRPNIEDVMAALDGKVVDEKADKEEVKK